MLAAVLALNIAAWAAAISLFHNHALLFGSALLAYGLGLRHAVDADHIAAIDNVTRKMMQDGKRPAAVGLFFSLGHSTIVVSVSLVLAIGAAGLKARLAILTDFGIVFGMAISAAFLLVLAALNMAVFYATLRTFRRTKREGLYREDDLAVLNRGPLGRLFLRLFRLVNHSWHMYPIGVLFGLGFDTATEIGLLGLSAAQGARGLPLWTIMMFPALFTAGMSLIDTIDSVLMVQAYGWALIKPLRKLYYNLTVTGLSVAVALAIGGVEMLALLRDRLNLSGSFWRAVALAGSNLGMLGYLIIALFAVNWAVSVLIYKLKGYDHIPLEAVE